MRVVVFSYSSGVKLKHPAGRNNKLGPSRGPDIFNVFYEFKIYIFNLKVALNFGLLSMFVVSCAIYGPESGIKFSIQFLAIALICIHFE